MRTLLALSLLLSTMPVAAENPAPDPFQAIEDVRRGLAAKGPVAARFEQSFIPAGFTSGEVETGTLALQLPRCLRWDYLDPDPKSFLLCDLELYSWIPGESSGQLVPLEDAEQPGLDLLLLPRERLEALYSASWAAATEGQPAEIVLAPKDPDHTAIATARLAFTAETGTLDSLSWSDREGNRSRFLFSTWESCPVPCDVFVAPAELTWEVRHAPSK
jgi:outer membrane lipoprotein-sorting protein